MSWMQTYRKIAFEPFSPRPDQFDIEDIAHSLSQTCRFGGHSREFYSVAEHSFWVAEICPPDLALAALLHDAAEAYIGDMIRPIKRRPEMVVYRELDERLTADIYRWAGLPLRVIPPMVKWADNAVLAAERDDPKVCGGAVAPWGEIPDPAPIHIACWEPRHAELMFLDRFRALTLEPQP